MSAATRLFATPLAGKGDQERGECNFQGVVLIFSAGSWGGYSSNSTGIPTGGGQYGLAGPGEKQIRGAKVLIVS